jgi:hypothetical protein
MKHARVLVILCAIVTLVSCVGAGIQDVKSYSEMTPQEKVGFAKRMYNNATEEYRWQYNTRKNSEGRFNDEDMEFLKSYLAALKQSHRGILLYESVVVTLANQEVTSVEAEEAMIMAIREMTALLGGKK